jgi:ABC-type phosphate transport system permease subunit
MNFKLFYRVFYPLKAVINNIKNKFRPSLIKTESRFALSLTLLLLKIYLNYCSQMGTLAIKGLIH